MKKSSFVFVILFVILCVSSVRAATPASDVTGSRYETAIRFLYQQGIVVGYPDGTFRPTSSVNRAEFVGMALKSAKITVTGLYKNCFKDVSNEWFANAICYAKEQGLVSGYPDGYFRPAQRVNKVEAITILNRVYDLLDQPSEVLPYTDTPPGSWYLPMLRAAHAKGLLEEQSEDFFPAEFISRGRTSDLMYRLLTLSTPLAQEPAQQRQRLTAADFNFLGSFRLPREARGGSRFGYGGGALALNPRGDPAGASDGYPGSLYIAGHEHDQLVAEVNIPAPQKQSSVSDLPTASYLQGFADVTGGKGETFDAGNGYRVDGLAYIDAQGSQSSGKLYWTARTYYNVDTSDDLSHGMSDLDLSNPHAQGMWRLANFHGQRTGGYIFPVPKYFADAYLAGKRLISGLSTQQGVSGTSQGPAFYAFAPWLNYTGANPPANEAALSAQALTYYPYTGQAATDNDPPSNFPDYQVPDSWDAAAWVDTPAKHAAVVVGRRSMGATYYGDGRLNDCNIYKGYHGEPYEPRILFYDPADLAGAAQGTKDPTTILPYLEWNPSQYLVPTCTWMLTGVVYDSEKQLLYIMQQDADTEGGEPQPLIYVFKIN